MLEIKWARTFILSANARIGIIEKGEIMLNILLILLSVTTYTDNGFNKDYHGQIYMDLTKNAICFNEDCSSNIGLGN